MQKKFLCVKLPAQIKAFISFQSHVNTTNETLEKFQSGFKSRLSTEKMFLGVFDLFFNLIWKFWFF